jgi:hypothetical protein
MATSALELSTYIGGLLNRLKSGYGELTYISGVHYVGNFELDKFNGIGTLTFPGDFTYSGSFRSDLPHGYGVKTYYFTDRCYRGKFKFGKYDGEASIIEPNVYSFIGHCTFDITQTMNCWSGAERTYTKLHSRSSERKSQSYITAPLDPQLSGFGLVKFEEGKVYCGGLMNGRFHGKGVLKYTKLFKRKVTGQFENGFLVGYYTICFPFGMKSWAKQEFGFEIMCDNANMPFLPGSYEDDSDLLIVDTALI